MFMIESRNGRILIRLGSHQNSLSRRLAFDVTTDKDSCPAFPDAIEPTSCGGESLAKPSEFMAAIHVEAGSYSVDHRPRCAAKAKLSFHKTAEVTARLTPIRSTTNHLEHFVTATVPTSRSIYRIASCEVSAGELVS
jgi:hypothetical protein